MPANDLEIRAPRAAELTALTALLLTQLRGHRVELPDAEIARAAAGLLARPQHGRFLIALESSALVGFAALSFLWTLEHGGRVAWLDELYVIPERRGHGIGAALLAAALDVARAAGAQAVDLEIEAGHERAASLYRRAGFGLLPRTRWARRLDPSPSTPQSAPVDMRGGCFCGAVRYRISGRPILVSHCHCSICRRTTGAPFVTWATVRSSALTLTCGAPSDLHSTPHARRTFCPACGTALTFQLTAHPESVDVTVGSLDDPNALAPDQHIWTANQLTWLHLDDDLPHHPERGSSG